ncbi:aminodeoxychorismate synthase component 2 [Clostridium tepidiprofundi DSM 19306]|uniref:Aminodeoxychorismate synthase component 2 n=1 Tax=Clostridium tepidiprofundi DSM 19306 TaxID=1121338 RepID=A0A151B548_9CLOT|nr:aminodeoxychorismate/anthranilate synthase component II [Clostridium tepidiprofundi]KYH35035.1 aminodeoxychorismate synthase component 2 [Clostridium tepidiprofundi DSM 19306]
MFLMIDNYDSFVYNLVRYFEELNESIIVFRNDEITIEQIIKLAPEGIIISPGPKSPKESGICLDVINQFKGKIPILGICLGHQAIGYSFGAKIVKGNQPVHGKVSYVYHNKKGVFNKLKSPLKVTRYHSLVIDKNDLPYCLEITSQTYDGVIMGIRHNEYFIEGVQFHPEAVLTEYGHEMLSNFIHEAKEFNKKLRWKYGSNHK